MSSVVFSQHAKRLINTRFSKDLVTTGRCSESLSLTVKGLILKTTDDALNCTTRSKDIRQEELNIRQRLYNYHFRP